MLWRRKRPKRPALEGRYEQLEPKRASRQRCSFPLTQAKRRHDEHVHPPHCPMRGCLGVAGPQVHRFLRVRVARTEARHLQGPSSRRKGACAHALAERTCSNNVVLSSHSSVSPQERSVAEKRGGARTCIAACWFGNFGSRRPGLVRRGSRVVALQVNLAQRPGCQIA